MTGIALVGPAASAATNLVSRGDLNTALAGGISRSWVQSEVANLSAAYATSAYTNNVFSQYATQLAATQAEALLVPSANLGVPTVTTPTPVTGIATLDSSGHVPLNQMPNVGVGYVAGPWGITTPGTGGSTTATPIRIGDTNIGPQGISFRPWCYASFLIQGVTFGRPCVEMRISNGAPTSYTASTLVARGVARDLWNDYSAITVVPVPDTTGESPSTGLYGPQYNTWISTWLFDFNNQTTTYVAGSFISSAVFLIRNTQ